MSIAGLLIAGLTFAAPSTPAHAGKAACSITGSFGGTVGRGGKVTMTNAGKRDAGTFALVITLPNGRTTNIRGNYGVSGDQMTMTNTFSAPASVQGCIGEKSVYALTWSPDCKLLSFHKVSDACPGRIADANGKTLTRQ